MGHYDQGMVCLNGHGITGHAGSSPEFRKDFCPDCGAKTITNCEACKSGIHGKYIVEGFIDATRWKPPAHCHNCGKPYPWTQRKADALSEMIDELEDLGDEEKGKLKKSIPDIIAETPASDTAVLRFKKAIVKAGQFGGKMLTEVLTKVAAEAVKKSMGL